VNRRASLHLVADLAALAGIAAFGFHAYGQIHGQVSVLDEGLYLVKGYLFAQGIYYPFQDYGPLTNHMPLAFLIPGWVQSFFGEGLRTGRTYALILGLVVMLLLWRTCRREGSPPWAAVCVWAAAINVTLVKIYSQATSQVLVATLILGVLYFGLGGSRKLWQILVASALAGLLWMTRINLLAVLPLLIVYLWLSHGRRIGVWATVAGGGVVLVGHALYWPEILKLWAKWLPRSLTPFLAPFRESLSGIEAWQVRTTAAQRWDIAVDSFRKHLVPLAGAVWAAISFPGTGGDPAERQRLRDVVFVGSLMVVLAAMHAYASLGLTYCPYCLMNYFAFFSPAGFVLLAIAGAHWLPRLGRARRIASLGFLFLIPFIAGLRLDRDLAVSILATQVPRASRAAIRPGTIELGELVRRSLGVARVDSTTWLTTGILIAFVLCLLVIAVTLFARRRPELARRSRNAAVAGLLALVLASATLRFSSTYATYDCGLDVIQAQEAAGADLRARLAPESALYWGVRQSPLPLLYLDRPEIFPAQLNGIYTFRIGGDPEELHRLGYWNQELAEDWLAAGDYALVDVRRYGGWLSGALSKGFDEMTWTPPTNPCDASSAIMIFRRLTAGS